MKIRLYQIDAFTDKLFGGNPAAVCPLNEWISDELLQKIASENNLAETAFYVPNGNKYEIRWFTPTVEVDLCGHATLAAAFVLFMLERYEGNKIEFYSPRSGNLSVNKQSDWLTLDFPTDAFSQVELKDMTDCFDKKPSEVWKGKTDYLFIYNNQSEIENITPYFDAISKLSGRGVIITAKGDDVDFVSRFFAPQSGIIEDPVTGSAHTTLTPYWAGKLNKTEMTSIQLSKRLGYLKCKLKDNRVEISGQARLYLSGEITIE